MSAVATAELDQMHPIDILRRKCISYAVCYATMIIMVSLCNVHVESTWMEREKRHP